MENYYEKTLIAHNKINFYMENHKKIKIYMEMLITP